MNVYLCEYHSREKDGSDIEFTCIAVDESEEKAREQCISLNPYDHYKTYPECFSVTLIKTDERFFSLIHDSSIARGLNA